MTALSDLTEAQVKALDTLDSEGNWKLGSRYDRQLLVLEDRMLAEGTMVRMLWQPARVFAWRLTPPSLALKRERMAQGGES